MTEGHRKAIDLGSQDLSIEQMDLLKEAISSSLGAKGGLEELVMLSTGSKPYQFDSLEAFKKEMGKLPNDASYFYYTLTTGAANRASLYLDPDRPAKLVLEGGKDWTDEVESKLAKHLPKGRSRHLLHKGWGLFTIWASVLVLAGIFLAAVSLALGPEPFLFLWVLLISGMLGAYLSLVVSRNINPANTMSLSKRRRPYLDILLHFITVALGIISVIIVTVLLEISL